MRYWKNILTIAMMFVSMWSATAQPVSSQLRSGKVPEGTVYYLPKTAIHFHVLVERKVYIPGAFSMYAEKYLHLQDIQQEKQISHQVVGLQLSQTGVRDTSKCFVVNLKGKSATTNIHLSEDKVLLAVNDTPIVKKQPVPFVPAMTSQPVNPWKYLRAETQAIGSMAKKAELTAIQIAELQEHRQQLITGEAEEMPTDKAQLQLMLEEIDREHESLMSLFTGTTLCDTTEQVITLCPDKEAEKEVIFRISKQRGLVDKDNLSGIPFYLTIKDLHRHTQQQFDYPENKNNGGFYTNVPGMIRLTLYQEERQLASYEYPFAQFGFTELRGSSIFKLYSTRMVLNPVTGAVERLLVEDPHSSTSH